MYQKETFMSQNSLYATFWVFLMTYGGINARTVK